MVPSQRVFYPQWLDLQVNCIDGVAIQQARWAKYGIRTTYDKLLFWGLNGLYLAAGLGYARAGIVPPQLVFFSNVAIMLLSRLFL